MSGAYFPETFRVRVPEGLPGAVKQAAEQRHQTPGEWARRALLEGLKAQGISFPAGETFSTAEEGCP